MPLIRKSRGRTDGHHLTLLILFFTVSWRVFRTFDVGGHGLASPPVTAFSSSIVSSRFSLFASRFTSGLVIPTSHVVAAVVHRSGLDAAEFARRLSARGVETRPFFLGMHEQPVLRDRGLFQAEAYPVAERIARQGLYLPSGLGLQESQIDRVCEAVGEALRA